MRWHPGENDMRRDGGFTMVELLTIMALIVTLAAILMPRYWLAIDRSRATACMGNLRNIANALHVYANDYEGRFPSALEKLIPDYLSSIPTCPATQTDTYTSGYEVNDNNTFFTQCCKGKNHPTVGYGEDEPYYIFDRGLGP